MFTFFTEQDIQIKYQLPTNSSGEAVEAEINILWTNNEKRFLSRTISFCNILSLEPSPLSCAVFKIISGRVFQVWRKRKNGIFTSVLCLLYPTQIGLEEGIILNILQQNIWK